MCKVLHLREFEWSVGFSLEDGWRTERMVDTGFRVGRGFAVRLVNRRCGFRLLERAAAVLLVFAASSALAQSCLTSGDMEDATRAALTAAAVRYFELVA